MKHQPLILIPARLKATRLPNKPLADIHGEPMIVHVWRRAMESGAGEVVVATDHADIKAAIEKAGGKAVMTREDHPSGSDRIYEALRKIDPEGRHDLIINFQGDMPTIDSSVIRDVIPPFADPSIDIVTLAAVIATDEEINDPSVVKVAFDTNRIATDFRRAPIHGMPEQYHHIGIYAYRRATLERFVSLPPSAREKAEKLEQLRALENGMTISVVVVNTVPLGVDTPEHLDRARSILKR